MKKTLIAVIIVIIGIAAFILMSPKSDQSGKATNQSSQKTSNRFADVQKDVSGGALLLDVRTADEFKDGHFASATNFAVQDMVAGKRPDVAKDTKIYLYCHSGNRAGQAQMILKSAGYTNVESLGGLTDVEAMGGTVQK